MIAALNTRQEIDAELRKLAYHYRDHLDRPVVRMRIEETEISQADTAVSVVITFFDDKDFYEGRLECHHNYKGGIPNGTLDAQQHIESLTVLCKELNLEVRGGQWQRPR